MASSPRSSWSGSLTVDLLTIPVTLGKATKDVREKSLVTVCECHHQPVDRAERCGVDGESGPRKVKAVDVGDGTYRVLKDDEYAHIEESTKSSMLEILDAQPLDTLPLAFGMGSYYVRAKKDDRAAAGALAALTLGMAKTGFGCVVKLCKSAKQDLAVLHCYRGYLLMTLVPFVENFVRPGDQERAHMRVDVAERTVERVADLLREIRNPEGFAYDDYADEGLKLRQRAVDSVLAGEKLKEVPEKIEADATNIMDALLASIEARKGEEKAVTA